MLFLREFRVAVVVASNFLCSSLNWKKSWKKWRRLYMKEILRSIDYERVGFLLGDGFLCPEQKSKRMAPVGGGGGDLKKEDGRFNKGISCSGRESNPCSIRLEGEVLIYYLFFFILF